MNNIKLCIFDVDGVLVNSRALHYPATRDALAEYGFIYSREDDDNFGTIPTRHKLHLLAEYGNCLLYTSPSPRDRQKSRMPSSA